MNAWAMEECSTFTFQQRMLPYALKIYQAQWPGCEKVDLRQEGFKVHVLDKEYAIDSNLRLKSGVTFTLQEKFREFSNLKYNDFTQEYKNGYGTEHEKNGEWFNLAAQLYFWGLANETNTGFCKAVIFNVVQYKLSVESHGGIEKAGIIQTNKRFGSSTFYGIPWDVIRPAFIWSYSESPAIPFPDSDDEILF